MRGSTFLLRASSFYCRNAGKNLFFFSPTFFLSPSIRFSLSFFFSFLFFSFYLVFFFFSPLSTELSKWGNFPPLSSFATCHLHNFLNFFLFLFFFPINSSTCHLAQCESFTQVHHMAHAMCHSPRLSCGIHMIMPCVTQHPVPQKK